MFRLLLLVSCLAAMALSQRTNMQGGCPNTGCSNTECSNTGCSNTGCSNTGCSGSGSGCSSNSGSSCSCFGSGSDSGCSCSGSGSGCFNSGSSCSGFVSGSSCPGSGSGSGCSCSGSSSSSGSGSTSGCDGYCKPVRTINVTAENYALMSPLYYAFLPNYPQYNVLDNICLTFFPLYNGSALQLYIVYEASVYCNGSLNINTYIAQKTATGVDTLASPTGTFNDYNIGATDCGIYVAYRCGLYGDTAGSAYVFGVSVTQNARRSIQRKNTTVACRKQAYSIADKFDLDTSDMYVLPNKLPSQCVFHQLCQPQYSLVYRQQGRECAPFQPNQ